MSLAGPESPWERRSPSWSSPRSLSVLPAERDVKRSPHPELVISVVAVEHRAGMEAVSPMALGSRVAEACLKRIAVFPDLSGINDAAEIDRGGEVNGTAAERLQMP